jgi:hypothetical protein
MVAGEVVTAQHSKQQDTVFTAAMARAKTIFLSFTFPAAIVNRRARKRSGTQDD